MPWWQPTAEKIMLLSGVAAFLTTLYWVRSRDLREKYAILWLIIALGVLVLGLFPELLMTFAETIHFSYSSAVLLLVAVTVYIFSFAVSVSETRQYRRSIRLAQELAILEARVQRLEAAAGKTPPVER